MYFWLSGRRGKGNIWHLGEYIINGGLWVFIWCGEPLCSSSRGSGVSDCRCWTWSTVSLLPSSMDLSSPSFCCSFEDSSLWKQWNSCFWEAWLWSPRMFLSNWSLLGSFCRSSCAIDRSSGSSPSSFACIRCTSSWGKGCLGAPRRSADLLGPSSSNSWWSLRFLREYRAEEGSYWERGRSSWVMRRPYLKTDGRRWPFRRKDSPGTRYRFWRNTAVLPRSRDWCSKAFRFWCWPFHLYWLNWHSYPLIWYAHQPKKS